MRAGEKQNPEPILNTRTIIFTEPPSSYIDQQNLIECLEEFFYGNLNQIDTVHLSRLYRPLRELIPNNSLLSQIDHDEFSKALLSIDNTCYYAIHNLFQPDDHLVQTEVKELYTLSNSSLSYEEWLADQYAEGICQLSEVLKKML